MTRIEIYNVVTGLLDNIQLDSSVFNNLLDIAQMQVEGIRPWIILQTEDDSQSVSAGDTSAKRLPADFLLWPYESSVQLIDAQNNASYLLEVPYSERAKYRQTPGRFCVNYSTNEVFILGNLTQSYTVRQNYVKSSTLVSTSDSSSWVFPSRYHNILPQMIVSFWRKGVDYDIFNSVMGDEATRVAQAILDVMTRWDSSLQQNMQRGKVFFESNSIGNGTVNGGVVSL